MTEAQTENFYRMVLVLKVEVLLPAATGESEKLNSPEM